MKQIALILLISIFLSAPVFAQTDASYQPTPVEISQTRAQKGSEWFFVHKVLPKQTMYSICRAYGVTQQEVYEANSAALETGLKTGIDLYIPIDESLAISDQTAEDQQKVNDSDKAQQEEVSTPDVEDFLSHRVKWYESIYTIARKYNITPDSILKTNNLKSGILKTGQILKIPKANYNDAVGKMVEDEFLGNADDVSDEVFNQEEAVENDEFLITPFSGKAKIALILPFKSTSKPSSNYLDFYSGFLLAINKIKAEGTDVDLTVYDLSNFKYTSELASAKYLGDIDFVVGPVMSNDIEAVMDFCNTYHIPLISPMDQDAHSLLAENPYLIQAPVSSEMQLDNLIKSIGFRSNSQDNVVVIRETGSDASYFNSVEAALQRAAIPYKIFSYGILSGRQIDAPLRNAYLDLTKHNHVIIASEKEAFASDAVRNISLLAIDSENPYQITGYGSNRLRSFETIEIESYQNISMHFSLGYYVDYSNTDVKDFVLKYRALFRTEPAAYAFQGYDLAYYFLNALRNYGKGFYNNLGGIDMQLLQSNMQFEKASLWGGFQNKATKDIIYRNDYSIFCR